MWTHVNESILKDAHEALPEEERKFCVPWMTQAIFDMIIDKAENFSLYRDARCDKSRPTDEVERLRNEYKVARKAAKAACEKSRQLMWKLQTRDLRADLSAHRDGDAFRKLRKFDRSKAKALSSQIQDKNGRLLTTRAMEKLLLQLAPFGGPRSRVYG